jgi:hypothetical protein
MLECDTVIYLQQICNIDKVTFVLLKDRVWEDECKKDFHAMAQKSHHQMYH